MKKKREDRRRKMRLALAAWEIGRVRSGLGAKVGGLGVIVEELPAELIKAAAAQDIDLEIQILSPCFAHYDRRRLEKTGLYLPAQVEGHAFRFEVYEHVFEDGQKSIYFWDPGQLHWTHAGAIYPDDPFLALKLFASVCQAMAGYIAHTGFDTVHLHDYHVGLIPFYLGDELLERLPVHLTIHNASYQGIVPLLGGGYSSLDRIGLPGEELFHKYFDFFDNLNMMKACMLKVHETGGRITTVSGDLAGTWGYAAELREGHAAVWSRAYAQKGAPPGEVFVPNRHLDLFEKLPVAGITNGMSVNNRPENLPELRASTLQQMQAQQGPAPLFRNPIAHNEMIAADHDFDVERLEVKAGLKRLLHLEAFDSEPAMDPILLTAVGRLVAQKNLGLVVDIADRTLAYDPGVKFVILASAPESERSAEDAFRSLAFRHPGRVFYDSTFNLPLSKLILAGGDFCLIPSRFEPCGLVDFEASLLGNVVIGRRTGGLAKVAHCAYLYDWLDIRDRAGEASAFFGQIRAAIDTYRRDPGRHQRILREAMAIDASWDRSASQYVDLYRFGFLSQRWLAHRRELIDTFRRSLGRERALFVDFLRPAQDEYSDPLDWQLRRTLDEI
ncbi:MAG: glycogen/starch synthase [Deltaproteobacteria bacterium]|nr:glycogen/starch synthase [Deltaproteobacteria bacterium]